MSKKRRDVPNYEQMDLDTRFEVQKRDDFKCVLCSAKFMDVHEIIPRRQIGTKNIEYLFHPMNRVCLCRECHNWAEAKKSELLELLYKKYNYKYIGNPIFERYLFTGDIDE